MWSSYDDSKPTAGLGCHPGVMYYTYKVITTSMLTSLYCPFVIDLLFTVRKKTACPPNEHFRLSSRWKRFLEAICKGYCIKYGGGGKAGASTYLEVCACVWLYWTLWTGYWTFSKVQQESEGRGSDDTFHSEALLRGTDAHKQYLGCFQSMDAHR